MIADTARPRLRSKRRLHASEVPAWFACVQGLVIRGYNMTYTRYVALTVTDSKAACAFIGSLAPTIQSAAPWTSKPASCVNLAFTYPGLQHLNVDPAAVASFWPNPYPGIVGDHQPFVQGSVTRAAFVGDTGASDPTHWRIDDRGFDVMLVVNAEDADVFATTAEKLQQQAEASGFKTAGVFESQQFAPPFQNAVYFGYQDGIAEPIIPGIPRDPDGQGAVDPGWFVLGTADPDGDAQSVTQPNSPLGDHGSFASFRIMQQDVAAFERYIEANHLAFMERMNITDDVVGRAALMAVLVGRWPNGQPLVRHPISGNTPPPPVTDPTTLNDYLYQTAVDGAPADPNGAACPFGSHMRRANPRDDQLPGGPGSAAFHRIMRRANPYQVPFDPTTGTAGEVGLLGFFMCATLANQFEFIMNSWINGTDTLPGRLNDVADPILGNHPPNAAFPTAPNDVFTTTDAQGTSWTLPISNFIYTRGSAYVFLPGIDAIRWIANPNDPKVGTCAASSPSA